MPKMSFKQSYSLRRIVDLMKEGKLLTKHTAADDACCSMHNAQRILGHLWIEGMTHIASWERTYNNPTPRYRWGKGKDAPRPEPMSSAEKKRKQREDPAYREKEAARKRWANSVGKEVRLGVWGL